MDIPAMFRRAAAEFDARVRQIGDHQRQAATPDEDWSVRDLVNHLAGLCVGTPARRGRATIARLTADQQAYLANARTCTERVTRTRLSGSQPPARLVHPRRVIRACRDARHDDSRSGLAEHRVTWGDIVTTPKDPFAVLRTKKYVALLILAAVLGVVISFLVYWFLKLIADIQTWVFTDLPKDLGFKGEPPWWPLLPLAVAGAIVGATIRYLPGRGGHSPADGFKAGGVAAPNELPGILLAALAGLSLGAVIGPEAPLIALGGGLAVLAVKLARRDMEPSAGAVIAATGSFAAISTLLGNPLAGAFLLLEASGLGGPMATIVLIPGLLGASIGSLIFLGLNAWTGYGTFSLAIPDLPPAPHLTTAQFGWALAIGAAAAIVSSGIRWLALFLRPHIERRLLLLTPLAGLVIAGLAIAFAEATGKPSSAVLFSGQTALPPLLENAASYTVGTLVLLMVCKGLAYSMSLSSFRGGPTFPGMFIGAAGGIALSHLPGLPMVTGAAIGIGAMTAGMLQLPMTAVLLTTLFLGTNGITTMPPVIVAVVVSFVLSKWLAGPPTQPQVPEPAEAAVPPQVR